MDGVNPIQDVSVPRGTETKETYAYSLEEILQMLTVLPEPAATIVAAAAFTGVRRGELRGLLWENYSQNEIRVAQSAWEGIHHRAKDPKEQIPGSCNRVLGKETGCPQIGPGKPREWIGVRLRRRKAA